MSLKIAILGTRGVPNNYGGFEHFAQHLSRGLVEKGHEITVYNSSRHPYQQSSWHGVKIVHCFDPEHMIGVAGQFVYDLNCIMDTRSKNYDIVLMLGYTSSSVWKFLYPTQSIIITNMDGMEWKRTKYSKPVRRFLKYAEKLAVLSSRFHIADSPVIKQYLDSTYKINSRYIAYGADSNPVINENWLQEFGLRKQHYLLLMARMEPENNIEMILDGYCLANSSLPFIVIGNTANSFGTQLVRKYSQHSNIKFLGAIFDEEKVKSLTAYCSLYFHGHSVGGTNPSLLDAMAVKAPLAAHGNPFNQSILQQNALFFNSPDDVRNIIDKGVYANAMYIANNHARISNEFTWQMIIEQYENYFVECHYATRRYKPLQHEKSIAYKGQY